MSHKSYGFDNTRFFIDKSEGGKESRWDGWVKITVKGYREFLQGIDPERSALVVVDMQKECCTQWPQAIARYDANLAEVYSRRLMETTIPNISRLLDLFRKQDMLVVYLTLDKDSIIPEIAPSLERLDEGDWWERKSREFVIGKYSSGAFATSALDNVLRENGIATIFFTGVDTCGCVAGTMSEAYDRAYQTILVEDACASSRAELHEATVKIWAYKGFVRSTTQVVSDYPWDGWVDPNL